MRLSLVKTAIDERTDAVLAREARWLRELDTIEELRGQVPRLLDEGTGKDGRRYLVMSIAPECAGETRAFTHDHARFLATLGKARFRVTDFELSGCGESLLASLTEVGSFAPAHTTSALREAFHDCETALLYWTGPYVLAKGDFAPWNIRTLDTQIFVYDWGNARLNASPLDDVLHYLMIQRALRGTPVTEEFLNAAMGRAKDFAEQAYPQWPWRPPVIGALTLVYLLGTVLHYALASRRLSNADPVVAAYWSLIEKRAAWMPNS